MTLTEFSNEFDTLANSYSGTTSLNFDEYEKSVFLTKGQEEIVRGLYTGKILGEPFEGTEQLRRYLDSLIITSKSQCSKYENGLTENSQMATLPSDVWFITYESVSINDSGCLNNKQISVIPISQDEFHKIKNNPFRGANSRRTLRLDAGVGADGNSIVELISPYTLNTYLCRYLSQPSPIILIDLPDQLTINNSSKKTECKLDPGMHRMILEVAVNLAIKSKVSGSSK